MAILISAANGNLTSATTVWNTVSAGTGAIQQTKTASTNTTTSYVYGTAFTGTNTEVVDGLLLYCNRVNSTGTVTIALSEDNGTTDTRNLAVNASDLPVSPSWVFFKFGSSLTLDGGTDYKVGVKASSAGNATFFRDGTAGNWAHILRKTTLATAAAGDVMYIAGEHTGAGSTTTRTITMDSTATTDYGTGTDGVIDNGLEIGDSGILTYGTSSSTNYYLKLSGTLNIWGNGTLNIGTTGTPIPRTSTAVLEFDPVADVGMGLIIQAGGILNMQGLSRTSGKNVITCKLNTDEAANSTSLGVDTDTGWLDNDQIVVASTTRTATETEIGALNGDAGASTLTVDGFAGTGGGLLNAHGGGGTTGVVAEVINLTRNIKLRSATSTLMTFVNSQTTSTCDIDWVEFYYLGDTTSNRRGIDIATTTGTFTMDYCSLHDTEDWGLTSSGSAYSGTINNLVCYNLNSAATANTSGISWPANSLTLTFSNVVALLITAPNTSGFGGINITDGGNTYSNITVAGVAGGTSTTAFVIGNATNDSFTIDTLVCHSCSGIGIQTFSSSQPSTMSLSNLKAWRNSSTGFIPAIVKNRFTVDTGTFFGNANQNISFGTSAGYFIFKSLTIDSDATLTTAGGISFLTAPSQLYLINCLLGTNTAHSTADFINFAATNSSAQVYMFNTTLGSTTEFSTISDINSHVSFVKSHKHDQSSTTFKATYRNGIITSDTITRHTASGYSWKMTPSVASAKLNLPGPSCFDTFKAAVNASSLVTITAYVQKDGSYNGNAPRLVLIGGIVGGIASDVTSSLTVGASTWEQLSVSGTPNEAGVIEYYIDCDGTAGNVYVDDLTIAQ